MKRPDIFTMILLMVFLRPAMPVAETVEVVTFEYPPLQGRSAVSELGVDPEIVIAAFKASGIDARIETLPTKRAIAMTESAEALCMIGLMEYFDATDGDIVMYPLLSINFDVFYLKKRFPRGFAFDSAEELKPYSIGVLLGGTTDIFGKKNGLNVDGAVTLEKVFRKLYAGRNDLCVANDLAGTYMIESIFPGKEDEFGHYADVPYQSLVASAIFNRRHPACATMEAKFKEGLKTIVLNGTWERIVRKYYRDKPIPARCAEIMRSYAESR